MTRRMILLAVALRALGACTDGDAADPIDSVPYPSCTADQEPCYDALAIAGRSMPFYRNVSLTAANAAITHAVIVVHGASRDANNFFYSVLTAAEQDGVDATTAIVAPRFQCDDDSPAPADLYWACSGDDWAHGYAARNADVSSYAVIDDLVAALADKHAFPKLTHIVITGLSAGGQLTERYAATSPLDAAAAGVAISYVPLSPSSYLWLDDSRPAGAPRCAGDDAYPYGLEDRHGYVAAPTAAQLTSQLVARDVAYMIGGEDTLANSPGTDMDTSCEADAQGIDRLARARNFYALVTTAYGAAHTLTVVPGCMHSRTCMYFSPEVRARVLDYSDSPPPAAGSGARSLAYSSSLR